MRQLGIMLPGEPAPGCDRLSVEMWQRNDEGAPVMVELKRNGPGGKSMRFSHDEAWRLAESLLVMLDSWKKGGPA
jgi:hypothetical protein